MESNSLFLQRNVALKETLVVALLLKLAHALTSLFCHDVTTQPPACSQHKMPQEAAALNATSGGLLLAVFLYVWAIFLPTLESATFLFVRITPPHV